MTEERKAAKKAEIRALDEEMNAEERKIYESYGLTYPPKWNGGRDTIPRPPELKELERKIALKFKAIQEKYKE